MDATAWRRLPVGSPWTSDAGLLPGLFNVSGRKWPGIYCGVAPPDDDPTYQAFELEATGKGVGAFFWQHDKKIVWIMMPCEPLIWSRFPIAPHRFRAGLFGESDNWEWNGSLDRPTLSPSLHWPNHWHGYFRAGQLVEA